MPAGNFVLNNEVLPGGVSHPTDSAQVAKLRSSASGLTALAGGGQTGATAITTVLAEFATVATAADSSILPAAKAGMMLLVANAGAASMNVFPASGEKINGGSANAAFAVANAKRCLFFCVKDGNWYTLLTA